MSTEKNTRMTIKNQIQQIEKKLAELKADLSHVDRRDPELLELLYQLAKRQVEEESK